MIDFATLAPPLGTGRTALGVLIDMTVRGSLLLVVAGLLTLCLRHASAALRHLVWNIAVAGTLALPALFFFLPSWRIGVLLPTPPAIALVAAPPRGDVHALPPAGPAQPTPPPAPELGADRVRAVVATITGRTTGQIVLAIWLLGVVIALAWLLIGRLGVRSIARRAMPVRVPAWLALERTLREQLGVRRSVLLYESDRVGVPMTWGVLRPVVLLPRAAHAWSSDRLRMALLHELAHVRRLDVLTHTVADLCRAVCWFNPLVWLAVRQMRLERERACDDCVLMHGVRASGYARDLLEIAQSELACRRSAALALAMARRSELEGRVVAILDERRPRAGVNPYAGAAMATMAAGVILPLATVRVVPKPRDAARSVAPMPGLAAPAHRERGPSRPPTPGRAGGGDPSYALAPTVIPMRDPQLASPPNGPALREPIAFVAHPALPFPPAASGGRPGHEQVRAFAAPVQATPLDPDALAALLADAATTSSSADRVELLARVAAHDALAAPRVRRAFLDAVGTLSSGADRRRVLVAALGNTELASDAVAALLRAARAIPAPADRRAVLAAAAPRVPAGGQAVREAYTALAGTLPAAHR